MRTLILTAEQLDTVKRALLIYASMVNKPLESSRAIYLHAYFSSLSIGEQLEIFSETKI